MKKTLISLLSVVTLTGLLTVQPLLAATVVWSGADTNTGNFNWSDSLNWSGGTPALANSIFFNDPGTALAASNINNIVDANTSILALKIGNTNGFHTTLINSGVTLTVTNTAAGNLVWVGTATDNGASELVSATVTGIGGHLAVSSTNVGSQMVVQQGGASGSHNAKLDLSGLDTFNLTSGRLLVGGNSISTPTGSPNASNYCSGTLILAKTNLIQLNGTTTPALNVADAVNNGANNLIQLGQTNGLFIDTITIAHTKGTATLQFNPAYAGSNPSLYLRGKSATRVSAMSIGDMSGTSGSTSTSTGTVDLSLGTVDAQVNICYVGRGETAAGNGAATGTLTLGAGVFNVNTLDLGNLLISTATGPATGTLNVNTGGTLVVNTNLALGYNPGASSTAKGTLNITNGTVYANAITNLGGNFNSTINMAGGTLVVSNTAGTPAAPITTVNLTSATLQVAAAKTVANVSVSSLNLADSSSVINVSSIPVLFGYPSQFPLISFASLAGGSTISLGTLPGTFQGYVSNDLASTIWVVVTNGPSTAKNDEWGGGVNSLWNTTTLNWTNAGVAVPYSENDSVTFDDLGKTSSVNLVTNHAPLGLIVSNNVLNYSFTGVGSVTGVVGLNKQGAASLTLAETGGDNFSGGVVVGGGKVILDDANCAISGGVGITNGATLQIGNNDTNGALPAGILDDEGTLAFSRTDNILLATTIPGGGGLTQNGNGTLILNSPVSYTGNTIISKGTLALTNTVSLSNSVSLLVSNATFDVSGLAGQTTILNSLTVTNATFNVAIAGIQPAISVVSGFTADGILSVSNKINVLALPAIASYPSTLTVIQSAGISLTAGNFNFALGSLPAGYAGSISESADQTSVLLTLTSGPVGVRPSVTWSGADVSNSNTNWSDRLNWQLPGAPTPADNVIFNNTAAVTASVLSTPGGGVAALSDPENFNNIVDANFSLASLTYTNLGATYHNTAINSGDTLAITNSLTVGGVDSGATAQTGFVTVYGTQATLSFTNPAGSVSVWNGSGTLVGSQATLDMSALDNFTATASRLLVGASAGNTVNRPSGVLYLARTNAITAEYQSTTIDSGSTAADSALVVGDCVSNPGNTSAINLGQVNVFTLDSVGIGRQKSSATLIFNSIYANVAPYPSVIFQGFSANAVTLFEIGNGGGNTGTTTLTADANLTGGFVTAAITTLNVGRASGGSTGTGTTTGSLEFDAGTISAYTVNIGFQPVANASKIGVGTVSVNNNPTIGTNATLSVSGSLNLALNVNGSATAGTLNISGGTVQANAIAAGINGAASTITLQSGMLVITNFAGTPAAPLTTLNLNGGTLQLDVNGNALVTNIVATTISPSGTTTINIGAIANGLGLTTIPLMSYTGSDPFSSLVLGTLPAGFSGTLVDNAANSRIDLSLTPPGSLAWVGAVGSTLNGNWNFGNLNWKNLGAPSAYADPEFAQFDDTASNSAVVLATTVSPSELNVANNTLNYVFSGSGKISGAASVTKSGSGTLTLAGTGGDNFGGGITVNNNGGKLILDNANSAMAGGTVIGSAATVQVGNNDANGDLPAGNVANNGTLLFAHANNLAVPGMISGSGNLLQSGSGVLTLGGANSYSGGTLISGGTLQLAAFNTIANLPDPAAGTGPITNNSVLSITNGGGAPTYMLITNTISGVGSINLPQNEEINFSGPGSMSSFTGAINIPAGSTLTAKGDISNTNVNLSASAIINVASGGTLWVANTGVSVPATLNLAGPGNGEGWGALRVDTAGIYSGPVILQGNATIGAQNNSGGTISGVISDGGHNYSVTKLGAQTVILTGANTYSGGTIISNATLQIGNGLVNGTLPGNANIAVTNATLSFVVATNTAQTCNGVISGPGSLYENGFGGTLNLNGMNTFTNGVAINAGALWITNAAAFGSGPKLITIVNGTAGHPELHLNGVSGNILLPATLSFTTSWIGGGGSAGVLINEAGNNEIDGSFNLFSGGGGSAFVVNGGTLKLAGNLAPTTTSRTVQLGGVGNGTVSGVIADNGTNILTGVTVVGPGTWTLAGTNTYVTTTTVSGGRLLVNGAVSSGGVTVQTSATFGGSGNAGGVTIVQSGGIIQGGDANYSNTLAVAALNLGNTNNVTTYSRFTVATGGKVAATTLTVSGTNVVQILDPSLTVGTNTLFTYTGMIGGTNGFGGFQLGTLPSGVTAQLLNSGSAVRLAVTAVVTVNTNSPMLTNSLSGNTLTLSWPADHLGWRLQAQTNSLNAGLGNNWSTWPNSTNLTSVPIQLNPANPTVFFRLVYP